MHSKRFSLNYTIVLAYVISFVAIQFIGAIVPLVFPELLDNDVWFANFNAAVNLVWYVSLTVALFYLGKIYLIDNQWVYFKSNKNRSFRYLIGGFFGLLAVNAIVNGIMMQFGYDISPENQAAIETLTDAGIFASISLVIFAGFLAPISEEIVFRKGIYGLFHKRFGNAIAIVVNSLLFGFIHIMADLLIDTAQWINIIPYAALGAVLSLVYYWSGKIIFIPIFIHMAYNLIAVALLFFGPDIPV